MLNHKKQQQQKNDLSVSHVIPWMTEQKPKSNEIDAAGEEEKKHFSE